MKYTFQSNDGRLVTVEAQTERQARKQAMIELWDKQGRGGSIVSDKGEGLLDVTGRSQ